jgi:hypothetical protein
MTSEREDAPAMSHANVATRTGARRSGGAARAASRSDAVARSRTGSAVDWMFRSRATGRITIVQRPNLALAVALCAIVVRIVLHPAGTAGLVLTVLVAVALAVWAVLEIVRGVNPWRRLLGAVVLALAVLSWIDTTW